MRTPQILNDLLSRVMEVGEALSASTDGVSHTLEQLCERLLSGTGEASGLALAQEILSRYAQLDRSDKLEFFFSLRDRFGVDQIAIKKAVEAWRAEETDQTSRALHFACEPRSQELIRRLNRVPGGTEALVSMRADLLTHLRSQPSLKPLDDDFLHLFGSWFNRGFLELRTIDWDTSATILEKVIAYEAVHQINGWNDLHRRVGVPDRRLFAFFHPALGNEPLIFVEVALMGDIPDAISPILVQERVALDPQQATTAVFYSISNCQPGLRGVSFGNFLIKQVVEDLRREFAGLKTFVTLSPVPGLRKWAEAEAAKPDGMLSEDQRAAVPQLSPVDGSIDVTSAITAAEMLAEIAACYLVQAKARGEAAADPVARFHLGNGARLERINLGADHSARGLSNSWGVMVNYLYDLNDIERNHEAYATQNEVIHSASVARRLTSRKKGA